ncbi:MAG: hypothetical protein ACOCXN_07850, partial [Spirochaetota bacterium]
MHNLVETRESLETPSYVSGIAHEQIGILKRLNPVGVINGGISKRIVKPGEFVLGTEVDVPFPARSVDHVMPNKSFRNESDLPNVVSGSEKMLFRPETNESRQPGQSIPFRIRQSSVPIDERTKALERSVVHMRLRFSIRVVPAFYRDRPGADDKIRETGVYIEDGSVATVSARPQSGSPFARSSGAGGR